MLRCARPAYPDGLHRTPGRSRMLLERKKSSYAEYRKTKSEMQDWLVAQKIVQEILKEDEQKKEQLHEQEVRQEEENRQNSR